MSLNQITLSPYLLTQLYPSSLIESEKKAELLHTTDEKKEAASQTAEWKFLGSNQKKVLVIVKYEGIAYLPDPQLEFLTQLLKACKMGLNDVALVNINNYEAEYGMRILDHFESKTVLLFGITPAQFGLPFDTPAYQVQHFSNYTVIHASTLESLENDKPAKGQLWSGLKKIFNL